MKKKSVPRKKGTPAKQQKNPEVKEPEALYAIPKHSVQLKDFTYSDFEKIMAKSAFNTGEWAILLHISERTLQRYAKGEGNFGMINAEKALHIDRMYKEGKNTFGSFELFHQWLTGPSLGLDRPELLQLLSTYEGVENIITKLLRIQHGVFA